MGSTGQKRSWIQGSRPEYVKISRRRHFFSCRCQHQPAQASWASAWKDSSMLLKQMDKWTNKWFCKATMVYGSSLCDAFCRPPADKTPKNHMQNQQSHLHGICVFILETCHWKRNIATGFHSLHGYLGAWTKRFSWLDPWQFKSWHARAKTMPSNADTIQWKTRI